MGQKSSHLRFQSSDNESSTALLLMSIRDYVIQWFSMDIDGPALLEEPSTGGNGCVVS